MLARSCSGKILLILTLTLERPLLRVLIEATVNEEITSSNSHLTTNTAQDRRSLYFKTEILGPGQVALLVRIVQIHQGAGSIPG